MRKSYGNLVQVQLVEIEPEPRNDAPPSSNPNVSAGNSSESATVQRSDNLAKPPKSDFSLPSKLQFAVAKNKSEGKTICYNETDDMSNHRNPDQPENKLQPAESKAETLPSDAVSLAPNNPKKRKKKKRKNTAWLTPNGLLSVHFSACSTVRPKNQLGTAESKVETLISDTCSTVDPKHPEIKLESAESKAETLISNTCLAVHPNYPENKLEPAESKKKRGKRKPRKRKADSGNDETLACKVAKLPDPSDSKTIQAEYENYEKLFASKVKELSSVDSNDSKTTQAEIKNYEKLFPSVASSDSKTTQAEIKNYEKLFACEAEKLSSVASSDSKTIQDEYEKYEKFFASKVEKLSSVDSNDFITTQAEIKNYEKLFACEAEKLSGVASSDSKTIHAEYENYEKLFASKVEKLSSVASSDSKTIHDEYESYEKLFASKVEELSSVDSNDSKTAQAEIENYEKLFACTAEKLSGFVSNNSKTIQAENKNIEKSLACEVEKSSGVGEHNLTFSSNEKIPDSNYSKPTEELHKYRNPNVVGHVCEALFTKITGSNAIRLPSREENKMTLEAAIDKLVVKCKLSPSCVKLNLERNDSPCNEISYEWENLVDNEFVRRIDNNIKRTVDSILIPEDECKRILNEVIADLNDAFCVNSAIENRWRCIGPYSHGLVFNDTKITLSFECPPFTHVPEDVCRKLRASLCSNKNFDIAQVPELQEHICGTHLKTGKKIQIMFEKPLNVSRSLLVKLFLGMNPNLKYFVAYADLLLNKFCRHFTNASNLSFDSKFWLLVFYMQQKNLLPAVINVRKFADERLEVYGWDCSLPEEYYCLTERVSLYSLLLGFIEFYNNFDFWNYVVCPYLGRVLAISDLERLKIPHREFSVYLKKLKNPDQNAFRRFFLSVQDPTDLSQNIGINVDGLNEFKVMCHRLNELLPKRMADIQRVDCFCHILPDSLPRNDYNPCNFTKYAQLLRNVRSLFVYPVNLTQNHVVEAVRILMELVFRLEQKSIVIFQDCIQSAYDTRRKNKSRKFPVIHFEYYSSEDTWKSNFMKRIFLKDEVGEQIRVDLRCELFLLKNEINISCASNARFLAYFKPNFIFMLQTIMKKILFPS